jgi:opacity protein-like surface antigen
MKNILQVNLLTIITILIFFSITQAQSGIGVGGYLGGGVISGDSPNQSAFTSSMFFEFKTPFSDNILPRISFFYAQDFNKLLPESSNTSKYFPFLKGISLKGIASQNVSENYFVEEGAGFIAINDHTFSDVDVWNFGVVSSIIAGFDFRNSNNTGFRLGGGMEFAFSFANTFAKYLSFHVQGEYIF